MIKMSITICILLIGMYNTRCQEQFNLDIFFERTYYGNLINELICMTDSMALLDHPKLDHHERRDLEDTILGKLVRAHYYAEQLVWDTLTAHEIAYVRSWIDLAERSTKEQLLLQEIKRLQERLPTAT